MLCVFVGSCFFDLKLRFLLANGSFWDPISTLSSKFNIPPSSRLEAFLQAGGSSLSSSPPSFGLHLIFSNKRDKTTKLFPAPHCCRAPGIDLYIILENIHGSLWQVGISLVCILVFCLFYPQLCHAIYSFFESLSAGYGACWASLSYSKYHHCLRHHGH